MPFSPKDLTHFLHAFPPEYIEGGILVCCITSLLLMTRLFGLIGLLSYTLLAIIISNIQVLKATQFSFFSEPVALGTIVFSTTFLVSDIITEYYSSAKAIKVISLGFIAMLFLTIVMILTIGVKPLQPSLSNPDYQRFVDAHKAMEILFLPAPAIFLASLISYFFSQINDVWIFTLLKKITRSKHLWLRAGASTLISSLMDSFIFSTLAWVVFADKPIQWKTLIWTYALGTYSLRLLMSLINIPVIYLARYAIPKSESHV